MGRKRDRGSGLAHAALAAALGVALIAGVGGRPGPARAGEPPNPLLDWLNAAAAANGAHVEVSGEVVSVTDPTPDDPPVTAAVANLQQLQAYSLPMVPSWLSDCDASWTICSMRG